MALSRRRAATRLSYFNKESEAAAGARLAKEAAKAAELKQQVVDAVSVAAERRVGQRTAPPHNACWHRPMKAKAQHYLCIAKHPSAAYTIALYTCFQVMGSRTVRLLASIC